MTVTTTELCAIAIAATACVFDVRTARIPNVLTFGAAILGVLFHTASPHGHGLTAAMLGFGTGLLVFFPIFALGAMGAGDVKLMAALGAWLGWYPIVFVALYGSLAGGVLALAVAFARGYARQALTNIRMLATHWWVAGVKPLPALTLEAGHGLRLPYAVPIAVGLVTTLWIQ